MHPLLVRKPPEILDFPETPAGRRRVERQLDTLLRQTEDIGGLKQEVREISRKLDPLPSVLNEVRIVLADHERRMKEMEDEQAKVRPVVAFAAAWKFVVVTIGGLFLAGFATSAMTGQLGWVRTGWAWIFR